VDEHQRSGNALTLLTMNLDDPALYGRVVRDSNGAVTKIVEAKDANEQQRKIREVNAGIYLFDGEQLSDNLRRLSTNNAQGEYYLTDLIGMLRESGKRVGAMVIDNPVEVLGVNSRAELASVEEEIQRRVVERLMREGVTFRNPATVVIDSTVAIGSDSVVYPFVTLEGTTRIGNGCIVEPGVHLHNVTVGNDVHLKTGTVAEDAIIEDEATVGPYAHLRPGGREFCRDQEGGFRRARKGVASLVHRRCGSRRGREHRGRHDHLQLRRRQQAQDRARRWRLHRL
jgi:bifunctional UDP-N-acetylglucosamine pyrophosphorylase/glucosamine-1-phosphate N-acetyltransferase